MTQPTSYVIAHSSSRVVKDCINSLERYQWPYQLVPAVNGQQLSAKDWAAIGVTLSTGGKMRQRPGAQGCWMSHWNLWQLCVNRQEPIVILEHDAVVTDRWPNDIDFNKQVVKLYRTAVCKTKPLFGTWSKGSHAYTLTPEQAERLINFARSNPVQAVDKHLADLIVPWSFYHSDLVVLNTNRGPSSTSGYR